jgi:hypothetical protein
MSPARLPAMARPASSGSRVDTASPHRVLPGAHSPVARVHLERTIDAARRRFIERLPCIAASQIAWAWNSQ